MQADKDYRIISGGKKQSIPGTWTQRHLCCPSEHGKHVGSHHDHQLLFHKIVAVIDRAWRCCLPVLLHGGKNGGVAGRDNTAKSWAPAGLQQVANDITAGSWTTPVPFASTIVHCSFQHHDFHNHIFLPLERQLKPAFKTTVIIYLHKIYIKNIKQIMNRINIYNKQEYNKHLATPRKQRSTQ